jgi:signal peptidase I
MTKPAEYRKSTAREYFESIVIAVILALFVRTWAVQAFKIPTGSMENNLLIGDHLLVNKFVFGPASGPAERTILPMREIRRGDIVVFKYPDEPERDFIKRVIGLPGETVRLENGHVFVTPVGGNPIRLDEPYVARGPDGTALPTLSRDAEGTSEWVIADGTYFLLGDNRGQSSDSRIFGAVDEERIVGRAWLRYFPIDRIGLVGGSEYPGLVDGEGGYSLVGYSLDGSAATIQVSMSRP